MKNVGEWFGLVSAIFALVASTAGLVAVLSRRREVTQAGESDDLLLPQRLRTMQIIAIAILMGSFLFLAIAFFVLLQNNGQGLAPAQDVPVLLLVAAGMLAMCAPLAFILPSIQSGSALQRIAADTWQPPPGVDPKSFGTVTAKLLAVRQMSLLMSLALFEGTAFMGCIAYLLEGQPLALGVSGMAILLMLLKFPTEGSVRTWLQRQADQLVQLRQQGDYAGERQTQ